MSLRSLASLGTATMAVVALVASAAIAGQAPKTPTKASPAKPSAAARKVSMPPIPTIGYVPARPVDVAQAAYRFAGEHPEVLKYVPCYCGCESEGHSGNESCFVKKRDAAGNVLEWDMHGYGCSICIDVAREAMQLFNSGADTVAIRSAIERKWTPQHSTKTHTPNPPKKP